MSRVIPQSYGKPKYTKARVTAALNALRQGHTRTAAAGAAGINRGSFYNWLEEHPEFLVAVNDAEAVGEEYLLRLIEDASRPVTRIVVHKDGVEQEYEERGDWKAAAWILEKTRGGQYGKRVEVTGDGAQMHARLEVDLGPEIAQRLGSVVGLLGSLGRGATVIEHGATVDVEGNGHAPTNGSSPGAPDDEVHTP